MEDNQSLLAVKWLWISVVVCCVLIVMNGIFASFNTGVSYAISAVLIFMLVRPLAHALASWKHPISKAVSAFILGFYLLFAILLYRAYLINWEQFRARQSELEKWKQEHHMGTNDPTKQNVP